MEVAFESGARGAGGCSWRSVVRCWVRRVVVAVVALGMASGGVPICRANPQGGDSTLSTRACGPAAPVVRNKKRKSKKVVEEVPEPGNSCLEVRVTALEAQEHLQKFVRDQRWAVNEEEINDTIWTFQMDLGKEELLKYAKPGTDTTRVEWERGRVAVLVRSVDLADGYARVTASAHFEGFGESDDPLVTQRLSRMLLSNGKMESALTEEVRQYVASRS